MNTLRSFARYGAHRFDMTFDDMGRTIVSHLGEEIGRTRSGAIFLAARWLIAKGMAEPHHRIATYVHDVPSMSGLVRSFAAWTVEENDHGMRIVPYKAREAAQMQLAVAV